MLKPLDALVAFTLPESEDFTGSYDRKEGSLPPDRACRISTALVSLRIFRKPKLHLQREFVLEFTADNIA